MNENLNDMNERIDFFLENNIKVHIDLTDGTFLNGFLIKKVKENVYLLQEDKLGQVFVFSKSINTLQQNYKEGGK